MDNTVIDDDEFIKSSPHQKLKATEEAAFEDEDMRFDDPANLFINGDFVDIVKLLFPSPTDRDFLITGIEQITVDVKPDDLRDKTIVLLVVPLQYKYLYSQVNFNVVDAYRELSSEQRSKVFFVFVAVPIMYPPEYYSQSGKKPPEPIPEDQERAFFDRLLDIIPFPTIPFDDKPARRDVFLEFNLHMNPMFEPMHLPYWCVTNPRRKVVVTRNMSDGIFSVFGGAELYPFTSKRICELYRLPAHPRPLLEDLDSLLETGSPSHDFLLRRDEKVSFSSLDNKVLGLFFWINPPSSPFKKMLKEVYDAAKDKKLDFEIVQSRFLFYPHCMTREKPDYRLEQESYDDVDWLRVPFQDPRHRKLLRILRMAFSEKKSSFIPEFLVTVHKQTEGRLRYEISGAHILEEYGLAGHPFTRQALTHIQLERLQESVTFQKLFPKLGCFSGMQVIVLFADHMCCRSGIPLDVATLVKKLETRYNSQKPDDKEFEVVFVSDFNHNEDFFIECTRDMPWYVHPYSKDPVSGLMLELFETAVPAQMAAFDRSGTLVTKGFGWRLLAETEQQLEFPFISTEDMEVLISYELEHKCQLKAYYDQSLELACL